MKKMFLTWILACTAYAVLAGCDSNPFKDEPNPLADKSPEVQNAQKPGPEPVKELPLPENVLKIDSEDGYFVFVDGVEQEITITGRSFFENSVFNLEVTNIDSFPGAIVETVQGDKAQDIPATLKLKWTPQMGLNISEQTVLNLEVMISTTFDGDVYSYRRGIPVFVYRKDVRVPKILKVTGIPSAIAESAGPVSFTVEVEDKESLDRDNMRPTLLVLSRNVGTGVNISGYIKQEKVEVLDAAAGTWKITAVINLNNAELTPANNSGYFSLAVVSYNGIRSALENPYFRVLTSVTQPVVSWRNSPVFKAGAENIFSFMVFDPKNENNVTAEIKTNCASLPGRAECSCTPIMDKKVKDKSSTSVCEIRWAAPVSIQDGSTYPFEVSYKNKSINKNDDPTEVTGTFNGTIRFSSVTKANGPQ